MLSGSRRSAMVVVGSKLSAVLQKFVIRDVKKLKNETTNFIKGQCMTESLDGII
jgi:hypothetical protein